MISRYMALTWLNIFNNEITLMEMLFNRSHSVHNTYHRCKKKEVIFVIKRWWYLYKNRHIEIPEEMIDSRIMLRGITMTVTCLINEWIFTTYVLYQEVRTSKEVSEVFPGDSIVKRSWFNPWFRRNPHTTE